jgi:hypothetical protein
MTENITNELNLLRSILHSDDHLQIQGLYQFDQSINQWILCTDILSLASDDLRIPSIDHMCIPKQCQFITWNILSKQYIEIFKILKSFLPDLICLQEVTKTFLNILLNEIWIKENNYYIIIMRNILEKSSGQLMLMKNFRPRAFSIYSKEYIIARFGLNSKITIDLINLHLSEKSSQILEDFFKEMNTQNYMIIGDFNFGDYDIIEENILQKYKYQIHDLWKDIYDIDDNPGYTFIPSHNPCAQITSDSQISLRSDRYLLHKLPNLSYSIEHLETIVIDSLNNKHINQSDHYALQLIIHFRIRLINHHSALVILPTMNISESYNQCSTYINLFSSFFNLTDTEDDEENVLLPLRLLLAQYESFDIERLREEIKKLFPQCEFDNENNSNPSMTITRSIRYVYILQQSINDDRTSFHIAYQLPLGSVLEPIGLNRCDYISNELGEFFNKMNLYQNEKLFEQKQEKFNRLLSCFEGSFNKDTLHYFTYKFLPYGSFRLVS